MPASFLSVRPTFSLYSGEGKTAITTMTDSLRRNLPVTTTRGADQKTIPGMTVPTSDTVRCPPLRRAFFAEYFLSPNRNGRIRTCGLAVPNRAFFQTEPHPENPNGGTRTHSLVIPNHALCAKLRYIRIIMPDTGFEPAPY